jgi:hypothetical protein
MLGLRQTSGIFHSIGANLREKPSGVADEPFLDNPVLGAEAIRDGSNSNRLARGWSERAVTPMIPWADEPMRREEAIGLVARPDDIFRQEASLRESV